MSNSLKKLKKYLKRDRESLEGVDVEIYDYLTIALQYTHTHYNGENPRKVVDFFNKAYGLAQENGANFPVSTDACTELKQLACLNTVMERMDNAMGCLRMLKEGYAKSDEDKFTLYREIIKYARHAMEFASSEYGGRAKLSPLDKPIGPFIIRQSSINSLVEEAREIVKDTPEYIKAKKIYVGSHAFKEKPPYLREFYLPQGEFAGTEKLMI